MCDRSEGKYENFHSAIDKWLFSYLLFQICAASALFIVHKLKLNSIKYGKQVSLSGYYETFYFCHAILIIELCKTIQIMKTSNEGIFCSNCVHRVI